LLVGSLCALTADPHAAPSQGTPAPQLSGAARGHLEEIASVLEANWLRRDTMDSRRFRTSILRDAGAAQSIS